MVVITSKDDVKLHADKFAITKIILFLLLHLFVALIALSFIANYMLKASFIVGTISTVIISSVVLTSGVWFALKWLWGRISVNDKRYRFTGKITHLFCIITLTITMVTVIEMTLGVGIVMILGAGYSWWQLVAIGISLSTNVIIAIKTVSYMKRWTQRNIVAK